MAAGNGNGAPPGDDRPPEAAPDYAEPTDGPEHDELRQLLVVLRRSWHWIVLITAAATAVAAVRTLRLDPVYAATARLQLDRELPDPTAAKYVQYGDWIQTEYLNTQIRILESATLSGAAVEANARIRDQLAIDATGGAPGEEPSLELLAAMFRGGVSVTPVKDTYLVDITYQSTDPARCAPYANALALAYISQRESQAGQRTRQTVEKLGEQADLARVKVDKSERELREFIEKNQVPLIERNEEIILGQITANNQALTAVQQRRIKLDAELTAIQRVIELGRPLESAPAIAQSPIVAQLCLQLADAELEVGSLSERYGDDWPAVAQARSRRDQLKLLRQQEIETVRARLQGERDAANAEEQGLLQRARQLHEQARELSQRARLYENLKGQVDSDRKFYEEFASRLKDTAYADTLLSNVRFVDRALEPARIGPNHSRNVGLGVLVGLALSGVVVLLLERLGDRIRTAGEASRTLRLPVVGVVPEVREVGPDQLDLYAVSRPHSVYAEAFRRLRVQLDAVGGLPVDGCGVLLCSSGVPQEGKTLCAINIAIAAAQAGRRTLLIDGDMRGPRVHRAFDLPVGPGLAEVLKNKALWGTVIQQSAVANLSIMTAGKSDENPAEVLARGTAFSELLHRLRGHFDRIVIDTAPAAAVTDATLMAPFADATILVVSAKSSSRAASRLACTELFRVGAGPRGVVFNHQSANDADYYYGTYYRRYSFGDAPDEPPASPPAAPPPQVTLG